MISGWYGFDNAGDDAILSQFLQEMSDDLALHITVLSERPQRVMELSGSSAVDARFHYKTLCFSALRNVFEGG